MPRAPRIRQSVAAGQQEVAATMAEARALLRALRDGLSLKLYINGKEFPIKIFIDPEDEPG